MADNTKIEWATLGLGRGASFNPLRAFRKDNGKRGWACVRKNAACKNCYAATMNRNTYYGTGLDYTVANLDQVDLRLVDVEKPLSWKAPRGIFWCSMTDAFGEFVPRDFIAQMISVAVRAKQHRHAFLTKRPERMLDFFKTSAWSKEISNHVWLGASIHDQACAEEFMPILLELREHLGEQAIIWISAEPLLGPIDLSKWIWTIATHGGKEDWRRSPISWVVAGGESGSNARPMHPNWVRQLREQCSAAGVKYFFKQWGEWRGEMIGDLHGKNYHRFDDGTYAIRKGKKKSGRLLDRKQWSEFPL